MTRPISGYKGGLRGAQPSGPLPARPSGWPALALYAAALLLALVSSTLLVFAVALVQTGGQRSRLQAVAYEFALSAQGLMAGAFVNAVVLAAAAFAAARLYGKSVGARLRLGPTRTTPLGAMAAAAGMAGLSFACGGASELLRLRGTGVMDVLAHSLRDPPAGRFVAALFAIGVAPGFAEEAFFRGFLQTRLIASWGRWPAILVAAAAFGLIHLDPVQGSLAFVAGIFLGWVVERLGGIRPSILAHVTNNAIFVTVAAFAAGDHGSPRAQIAAIAAGVCVCIGAIVLLRSSRAVTACAAG